jgi:hypothetical protein
MSLISIDKMCLLYDDQGARDVSLFCSGLDSFSVGNAVGV